jgi:hypothetical protein
MKLYLRVHYGWLPMENTEGLLELDQAIEKFMQGCSALEGQLFGN